MDKRTHGLRPTRLAAACLLVIGVLAACTVPGSSEPASSPSPALADPVEQHEAYADCMREQGITDFPDPTADGIDLTGTGIDPDTEEFKAAHQACEALLPEATGTGDLGPAPAAGWTPVEPGGDCACSDGSDFQFWARPANPKKVLIYFEAGGACFTAELCDPANDLYNVSADGSPPGAGVFDFDDPRNPFADYSVIYVPYCTADVFLGTTATTYEPGLTIQHKGFANGTAALDYLEAAYLSATDVVVAGGSAGSVAAPLYGGLVADRLPEARVTVLADGSGTYPDLPELNASFAEAWDTGDAIGALTGSADESWSIPGLFTLTGRHHPDVMLARHDYAYDGQQARWYPLLDLPTGDLLARTEANERRIEADGVELLSYTAPGDGHVVLDKAEFYTETVDGHAFVDWVADLIAGEPVEDVRCTECAQ